MPEAEIRERLSKYLDAPVEYLRVLASGWETTVFEFALADTSNRCPEIPPKRPLVLRFYQSGRAAEKGARESRVFERLYSVRYRVPRPYGFEADPAAVGAPF